MSLISILIFNFAKQCYFYIKHYLIFIRNARDMKHKATTALLLSLSLILTPACRKNTNRFELRINQKEGEVSMQKVSDSLYILQLAIDQQTSSTWELPYPVYQFDYGDVTGDGIPEIAVGVIKPTRFDPKPEKRLFLYRIADGAYIRPLWLGSRVAQPLEDFRIIRDSIPAKIRTMERERSGHFLVAEYRWRGFGLDFKQYIQREIPKQEALQILKK